MEGGVVEGKNGWVDSFTCKGPLATDSNDWYVLTLLSTGIRKEEESNREERDYALLTSSLSYPP